MLSLAIGVPGAPATSTLSEQTVTIVVGAVIVWLYARRRFLEPTFQGSTALPETVDPLQYLFLKKQFQRAMSLYVILFLTIYIAIVFINPNNLLPVLGVNNEIVNKIGSHWPFLVALLLVGVVPSSFKWLSEIELILRKWVHGRYLVPTGVEKTIATLKDLKYDPPPGLCVRFTPAVHQLVRENMARPNTSFSYNWARASALMETLDPSNRQNIEISEPAALRPFEKDLLSLQTDYKAIQDDIGYIGAAFDNEELIRPSLRRSLDRLLERIYAYISWGIRYQASSEREFNETLEKMGFELKPGGSLSFFEIVFPAIFAVGLIVIVYTILFDIVKQWMAYSSDYALWKSVLTALSAGSAASGMYWLAVHFALKGRSDLIKEKKWRARNISDVSKICIGAGFCTWLVISAATLLKLPSQYAHFIEAWQDNSLVISTFASCAYFFFYKSLTAIPWFIAGATVGYITLENIGGSPDYDTRVERTSNIVNFGLGLAAAVAVASLLQMSIIDWFVQQGILPKWEVGALSISNIGMIFNTVAAVPVGFICGALLGLKVPYAFNENLKYPRGDHERSAIESLLKKARESRLLPGEATRWIMSPNQELGGIAPAEAVRFRQWATSADKLALIPDASQPVGVSQEVPSTLGIGSTTPAASP